MKPHKVYVSEDIYKFYVYKFDIDLIVYPEELEKEPEAGELILIQEISSLTRLPTGRSLIMTIAEISGVSDYVFYYALKLR